MKFIKLVVGYIFILSGMMLNIFIYAPFSFFFETPGKPEAIILAMGMYFSFGLIPSIIGLVFLLFKGKKYVLLNLILIISLQILIYLCWTLYYFSG